MELTAISLFSGIGGDTIAAQRAGFKTLCFVEWGKFCQAVLRKQWPDIRLYGDINEYDARPYRGKVTLVHGGDPCQPTSLAGQRRGTEDDRYLWPEMLRVIRECRPAWVINENPTGRLTVDFYQVLSDLEGEGYGTRAFVIPACGVNAPHRRDRVYIIAYNDGGRFDYGGIEGERIQRGRESRCEIRAGYKPSTHADSQRQQQPEGIVGEVREWSDDGDKSLADPGRIGLSQSELRGTSPRPKGGKITKAESLSLAERWQENTLEVAASLCGVDDGFPNRVARLKALGNAQVPQQIYPIFKGIADIEKMRSK